MTDTVAAAEADLRRARDRLSATIDTLAMRLAPQTLAQDAVETIVDKGQAIARDGLETAKGHPLKIAGLATALGLLLVRRPLARLLGRADTTISQKSTTKDRLHQRKST